MAAEEAKLEKGTSHKSCRCCCWIGTEKAKADATKGSSVVFRPTETIRRWGTISSGTSTAYYRASGKEDGRTNRRRRTKWGETKQTDRTERLERKRKSSSHFVCLLSPAIAIEHCSHRFSTVSLIKQTARKSVWKRRFSFERGNMQRALCSSFLVKAHDFFLHLLFY